MRKGADTTPIVLNLCLATAEVLTPKTSPEGWKLNHRCSWC